MKKGKGEEPAWGEIFNGTCQVEIVISSERQLIFDFLIFEKLEVDQFDGKICAVNVRLWWAGAEIVMVT